MFLLMVVDWNAGKKVPKVPNTKEDTRGKLQQAIILHLEFNQFSSACPKVKTLLRVKF